MEGNAVSFGWIHIDMCEEIWINTHMPEDTAFPSMFWIKIASVLSSTILQAIDAFV